MTIAIKPKRKSKPRAKSSQSPKPKFWSYARDRTKFRRRWIAFAGDVIYAVGDDASTVYAEAKRHTADPILELVMPARAL